MTRDSMVEEDWLLLLTELVVYLLLGKNLVMEVDLHPGAAFNPWSVKVIPAMYMPAFGENTVLATAGHLAIPNKLLLSMTKDLVLDEDLLLLLAILARLKNTYQCIQANMTNDLVLGAVNMTRDLVMDLLLDESWATSTKLLMTKDLVMAMELHLVLTVLVVDGAEDLVMEAN